MLSSEALHDDRIVALPDSIAPLCSLALPVSEGDVVPAETADLDDDDDDDDDEEEEVEEREVSTQESEEDVWQRLHADSDVRDRNSIARALISEHRRQMSEENELQVSPAPLKTKRVSWSPKNRERKSSLPPPTYESFSFSPALSERTKDLIEGSGRRVWDHLNTRRSCEKCTPPKVEEPSPPHITVKPKYKSEMHNRLYNDAAKERAQRRARVYRVKDCTFQPQISPHTRVLTSERTGSPYARLSRSPSPGQSTRRSRGDEQTLESCVTGLTVRSEPNLDSTRIRVLQKGDRVSVNVNTVLSNNDGVWGTARDGWLQITTPNGARSLVPTHGTYRAELQDHLNRHGRSSRGRSRSLSNSPRRLSYNRFKVVQRRLSLEEELDRLREMSL